MLEQELKGRIRDVPDWPKAGVIFKDITTLLRDGHAFASAVDALAGHYQNKDIDYVTSIEARGFIWGAPLAYLLGAGFVPVRKPGKLPCATKREEYALEYGTDAVEIHADAVGPGDRVLICDDLLATGGTALATAHLVEDLGAEAVGLAFVIELDFLKGRAKLGKYDVFSIIHY